MRRMVLGTRMWLAYDVSFFLSDEKVLLGTLIHLWWDSFVEGSPRGALKQAGVSSDWVLHSIVRSHGPVHVHSFFFFI